MRLFFGVLEAIRRRDRAMLDGLLLSLEVSGLAAWQGDALSLSSEAALMNPSDKTLENAERFYQNPPKPGLRGRRKRGRLRPPYLVVLMTYYRYLYIERSNGSSVPKTRGESASDRALKRTAKECHFPEPACAKILEKARSLFPELTRQWKGQGAVWVESK